MARLLRRICLLREQGEAAAAAQLEANEFLSAVRDFRLEFGPESLSENELQAMFLAEERRVADAMVLAELLVPRLVGAIPAPDVRSPRPVDAGSFEAPANFPKANDSVAGSTAIPDLLDAMLAADGAVRRQSANRRAY